MSANNHQPQVARTSDASPSPELMALRKTDRKVFFYLNQLCIVNGDRTCTVSLPTIAASCDISERQAQISAGRLIKAGLIKRTGYDLGNAVRSRRGTKYRLLKTYAEPPYQLEIGEIESAVQLLLKRQRAIESQLEQVTLKQDRLLSLVTQLVKQSTNGKSSKRPLKKS